MPMTDVAQLEEKLGSDHEAVKELKTLFSNRSIGLAVYGKYRIRFSGILYSAEFRFLSDSAEFYS